jgi:hypothetical protein
MILDQDHAKFDRRSLDTTKSQRPCQMKYPPTPAFFLHEKISRRFFVKGVLFFGQEIKINKHGHQI